MRWYFLRRQGQQNRDEQVGNQLKVEPDEQVRLFVREILQNSLDARKTDGRGQGPAVRVSFNLVELKNDQLAAFKRVLNASELLEHLSAEYKDPSAAPTPADIQALDAGPLWVLRIVECNTSGLEGPEDLMEGPSPFAALTKDQFSRNPNENAGGSYGVGKSVLWKFNQTRTALFLTRVPHPKTRELGLRFIGRTELRQRKLNNIWYQGSGWYCGGDGESTDSEWDLDHSVLEALQFDLGTDDWSTQILLAGLQPGVLPQTSDTVANPEEPVWDSNTVAIFYATVRKEVAKWCWPAIRLGRLECVVGGRLVDYSDWEDLEPYIRAFDSWLDDKAGILTADVAIPCPKRKDVAGHQECEQITQVVLMRTGDGSDLSVARFRHPGLVVDYWQGVPPRNEGRYVGFLPCGTAMDTATAYEPQAIQFFLRMAENETHDAWTASSPNLEGKYPTSQRNKTPKSALLHFSNNLRLAVETLVFPIPVETQADSRLLADFRLPGNQSPKPGLHDPVVELLSYSVSEGGTPLIHVRVRPRSLNQLRLRLERPCDNGKGEEVAYEVVSLVNATLMNGYLVPLGARPKPIELVFMPGGSPALHYDLVVKEERPNNEA